MKRERRKLCIRMLASLRARSIHATLPFRRQPDLIPLELLVLYLALARGIPVLQ